MRPPSDETRPYYWRVFLLLAVGMFTAPIAQYFSISRLAEETTTTNPPPNFLHLALAEKQQRHIHLGSDVILITPLGNTTWNDEGVHGLKCSMTYRGHNPEHLIRAHFDDSEGFDGLDVKKIITVSNTVQELSLKWPATTLIVVVDAFDVVIQGKPEEIIDAYNSQPYPILFGSETSCWNPLTRTTASNVSTPLCAQPDLQRGILDGRYLNSGVFMSTLGTLVRFFAYVLHELPTENDGLAPLERHPGHFNDQAYWGYWYTKYHPLIGLEVSDKFMVNVDRRLKKKFHFDNSTGSMVLQGEVPPIMHFPGSPPKMFKPYVEAKQFFAELC
ncbi:expressed unknown protein [Seminavis robusta]|uniref:PLOD1-3-like GT domain-containing protein n=1 Tax=Seminavis robusta TaxID=568900 RepID=A0A9N8H8P5_9STRA|nr:expressed unknown protein [Seminavis robusta]|eukprot:Sro225_g091910.1 n/a (330) ;mRNA; f:77815-78985